MGGVGNKVYALKGLGKNHVISFWKAHRELSDETLHKYWLGICKLWEWIDKHEAPPEPHKAPRADKSNPIIIEQLVAPYFYELATAIKFFRESQGLSIQKLANMTGIETSSINNIENGETKIMYSEIEVLLKTLNIQFSTRITPPTSILSTEN